jgi:hypothetical protein
MDMRHLRSAVLTMSIATAAGGVSATALADDNDLASKSPQELVAASKAALAKVDSVRVTGTDQEKSGAEKISGTFTAAGPADFSLTVGKATARVIALPKAVYVKGNAAYWKSAGGKKEGALLARKLSDKWIKESAKQGEDATSGLGDLSPKRFASCLDSHVGTLSNKGVKTVGGKKVVVIADAGDKPGTAPGELWIDAETSLPVREMQTGPFKAGGKKDGACDDEWPSQKTKSDVALSLFGKAPKVVAPKGAVSVEKAVGGDDGGGGTPVRARGRGRDRAPGAARVARRGPRGARGDQRRPRGDALDRVRAGARPRVER